jgi:putative hydrolase of the HAD superfamily
MTIVYDLDDTLYDEIDFVKSGFREISNYLQSEEYYYFMITEFKKSGSGKIFDKLIENYKLNVNIQTLIEIYRFHKPNIFLREDSKDILEYYKNHNTALISDGHYIMQQNKFFALNLEKQIKYPIFTNFYHTKKPETKAFEMVMEKYKDSEYIYISDNPKKDFFAPIKLGWKSIRYKNPNGIYKEIPSNADYEIDDLKKIKELI